MCVKLALKVTEFLESFSQFTNNIISLVQLRKLRHRGGRGISPCSPVALPRSVPCPQNMLPPEHNQFDVMRFALPALEKVFLHPRNCCVPENPLSMDGVVRGSVGDSLVGCVCWEEGDRASSPALAVLVFQAKQKVDAYHLQLQNLLYEVMHLQKEITKCLEFK